VHLPCGFADTVAPTLIPGCGILPTNSTPSVPTSSTTAIAAKPFESGALPPAPGALSLTTSRRPVGDFSPASMIGNDKRPPYSSGSTSLRGNLISLLARFEDEQRGATRRVWATRRADTWYRLTCSAPRDHYARLRKRLIQHTEQLAMTIDACRP